MLQNGSFVKTQKVGHVHVYSNDTRRPSAELKTSLANI